MSDTAPPIASNCLKRMRFDEFMHTALYHPINGYYSQGEAIFGRGGDFVTAPEISPLFGQTLGDALQGTVALCGGTVWEFGAGRGKLAAQLLNTLGPEVLRYCIVDVSGGLADVQKRVLAEQCPLHAHKVEWISKLPDTLRGVVIGNEVLDAMPVRLWRRHEPDSAGIGAARIRELWVDQYEDGTFDWVEIPADAELTERVQHLHERYGPWPAAYQSEWGEQAEAFVSTITERLHGVALMVDYGFPQHEFYHPQRNTGTLVAHRKHQMHSEVLQWVGEQDLTAHVDFTAMYEALTAQGGELLGYCSQAQCLLQAGVLDRASAYLPTLEPLEQIAARQQLHLLLSEAEMGELFKVLAWCKGVETDPTRLAHVLLTADRSHQL